MQTNEVKYATPPRRSPHLCLPLPAQAVQQQQPEVRAGQQPLAGLQVSGLRRPAPVPGVAAAAMFQQLAFLQLQQQQAGLAGLTPSPAVRQQQQLAGCLAGLTPSTASAQVTSAQVTSPAVRQQQQSPAAGAASLLLPLWPASSSSGPSHTVSNRCTPSSNFPPPRSLTTAPQCSAPRRTGSCGERAGAGGGRAVHRRSCPAPHRKKPPPVGSWTDIIFLAVLGAIQASARSCSPTWPAPWGTCPPPGACAAWERAHGSPRAVGRHNKPIRVCCKNFQAG